MNSQEPSTEAIHRSVSNHVLKFIPVTPNRAESLTWPLGFLTARCKDAGKDIQTGHQFTKSETRVSEKILPWEAMLDIRFRDQINELKQERYSKKGAYEGKSYFPPLVIRAKSGFGKSILLGKVVAELIDSKFFDGSNEWRTYDRIVFSQLKDQTGDSLEYAICNGMDDFHKCEDLETFFEKTKEISEGQKVLLIDSLDEHSERKQWWNISERLSAAGWMVVWSCRDPDWDHHELGKEPPEHLRSQGKDRKPPHWERFTGFDWTLELGDARMAELNPIINQSQKSTNNVKQFVKYCYSKTQLMHIYHTNFDMRDAPRRDLDRRLLEELLKVSELFRGRGFRDREITENDFLDPEFYHTFFEANLAKIIIDTSINFLENEDYEPKLAWRQLCNAYYRNRSKNRRKGQLDESLSFTDEDEIPQGFIDQLQLFGILREGRKFRHRDFATIAYVTGCDNGLEGLRNENDDILFKHFFPYAVLDRSGALKENESDVVIDDFLRRTGNMMSQLKIFDKETDVPKNLIAQMSDLRKDDSVFNNKGLSASQKRSLKLGEIDICTVLHGVPGSGKTYSGVEFMLVHQAQAISEGRTDSKALIVALNKQLAKSIEKELKRQHRNSPLISNFSNPQKDSIFNSIKVKSLDEVLEEWLPEETVNFSKKWKTELRQIFGILESKPKLKVERKQFRWLEEAFQKDMFDRRTGALTSKEMFLSRTVINQNLNQDVCSEWYDEIKRQKENGRLTIIEACTLLRNRLLRYEHHRSREREAEWNSDYDLTKEGFDWDKNKEFNRYAKLQFYDFIMIDEVQDLPEMAVQMLSFLSPNRKGKAFVLAGDKLQTLNGRPFDWQTFLDALTNMTKLLATDHKHIYHSNKENDKQRPTHHHLRGLYWTESEVNEVIHHHLNENHRNHPGISKVATLSWEKWPSTEYYEEVKNSYPLEKMKSKYSGPELNNPDFSPLMIVESKNAEDFNEKAKIILRFLNARAKVSLLYTNTTIRDYISKKVMKDNQKIVDKLSVESFTPWTIKGLERDAVVIFGAYTASANDTDTSALWREDFTRLGEYSDLSDGVISAIDLMRRKMIVANTRAVEQLVVVNLPREETNLANQKEYRIKSLQPPKFNSSEVGFKVQLNDDLKTLEEDLKRFFKESKIKREHFSLARLSEGLNIIMRARDEPDLKEEFEFFRSSLKTILEDDIPKNVPNSVLREVLTSVLNNPKDCELNKLEVINDLLQLDENKLSFMLDGDGVQDVQNNHYSDMIKQYQLLKSSSKGPWSSTGFVSLFNLLDKRNTILREIKNSKESRELRHQAAHEVEIFDDIETLLDNFIVLIERFGLSSGLPKTKFLKKHLYVYLFSDQNNLKLDNAKYRKITESAFALKILESFDEKIKFDEQGELVYEMASVDDNELSGHLKIRSDVWEKFTKDISSLKFEDTQRSEFATYAVRMVRLHHQFLVSDSGKNREALSTDVLTRIKRSNANAMNYLVSLGDQDALENCREPLVKFIKNKFVGMEDYSDIKKFLQSLINTKAIFLNQYIEDKDVLKFDFKKFNLFTNALKSATLPQFVDRARLLYSKADYVNRLIGSGIVSIQSLDSSIYNVGKVLVHKVTEESTYSDYETLISGIKRDILKNLLEDPSHLESDIQANIQWKNMSVLNRLISLAGLNFGNNFDLDSKIFDKLSDEYIQSVVKDLEIEINYILSHELQLEEASTSVMVENLLRNILFAQQLVIRNPNARMLGDGPVAEFPVMQQSGIYELNTVTDYPNYFAPDFSEEKEEMIWVRGNESLKFFPNQRKRIDHLKLVSTMQQNWEVQVKLYSALYNHDSTFSKDTLAWRFEGFGELMPFSSWMTINEQIRSGTRSEENVLTHVLILNEYFDFTTRIKNYVKVIEAYLQVLESRNTKTIGIKVLLQESLSNIFSLQDIIKSKGIDYDFDVKAFPQGKELTVTIKKNGKLKIQSWAQDVPDIVSLTGYLGLKGDKLDREKSIDSLKLQLEVLREYLELEKTELLEKTESAQRHGNLIIEGANNIDEMLANVARETAKERAEKMTVLVTEDDFDRHVDSLDEDELDEFVEAFNQETEEIDDDIDDRDIAIIKRFNLTEEAWVEMEEHRKQFYRDEYEKLG